MELTRASLKTARAWAIKEQAGKLWHFTSRTWVEKGWRHLLRNAVVTSSTNAIAESLNARIQLSARIQKVKAMACGFRNRERFRRAILFHLGGLDLMPAGASYPTHTKP